MKEKIEARIVKLREWLMMDEFMSPSEAATIKSEINFLRDLLSTSPKERK